MAEGTLQILGLGTSAVPLDYNVSGNQPLDLIAVKADFDGTSAGSDFVPVIEILSSADKLMAQSIGSTVAAGDSVTVTFAPFLRDADTGTGGSGIQFDTYPQAGGFLYAEADSFGGPHGVAIELADPNANGIQINSGTVEIGDVDQGSGQYIRLSGGGVRVDITGGASFNVCEAYNGPSYFAARSGFAGRQISFFGHALAVQQPTPVTLGDVIALLQAYGLSA